MMVRPCTRQRIARVHDGGGKVTEGHHTSATASPSSRASTSFSLSPTHRKRAFVPQAANSNEGATKPAPAPAQLPSGALLFSTMASPTSRSAASRIVDSLLGSVRAAAKPFTNTKHAATPSTLFTTAARRSISFLASVFKLASPGRGASAKGAKPSVWGGSKSFSNDAAPRRFNGVVAGFLEGLAFFPSCSLFSR